MKNYDIEITEIYKYRFSIQANNKDDALKKAKEYYETCDDGVTGVADACSHDETKFKVN